MEGQESDVFKHGWNVPRTSGDSKRGATSLSRSESFPNSRVSEDRRGCRWSVREEDWDQHHLRSIIGNVRALRRWDAWPSVKTGSCGCKRKTAEPRERIFRQC